MTPPESAFIRVMLVEDDPSSALITRAQLKSLGYHLVGIAQSALEAIQLAGAQRPDIAIVDIHLGGHSSGLPAAEHITDHFDMPVVFLTADEKETTFERAKETGHFGFLIKPVELLQLRAAVETAVHRYREARQAQEWETLLWNILSTVREGIMAADSEGRLIFLNETAAGLSGTTPGAALGMPIAQVLPVLRPDGEAISHPAHEVLSSGKPLLGEQTRFVAHGITLHVAIDCLPMLTEQRRGVVIIVRNLAESREK